MTVLRQRAKLGRVGSDEARTGRRACAVGADDQPTAFSSVPLRLDAFGLARRARPLQQPAEIAGPLLDGAEPAEIPDILRAPMTGPLNEAQSRSVNILDRNVRRLSALLRDLLDASRVEGRGLPLVYAPDSDSGSTR